MPYHIRSENGQVCVYKGTKGNPGKKMHCYSGTDAKAKARKYLAALYANVTDAKDEGIVSPDIAGAYSVLRSYRELAGDDTEQDRWIAVSTVAEWDRSGEMVTKEAMDYDIARVIKGGEYPELRLWHVRGFKLGMCDAMMRVGDYAVDFGYWYDTPLAQSMKSIVEKNDGTWRVSRGFYPVRATGRCVNCDNDLMVGPVHFMFGMRCPVCKSAYVSPSALAGLKYTQMYTYDVTITDVPMVPSTAVSAWSVETKSNQQENTHDEK